MLIIKHPSEITDKEPCLLTQNNSTQIFLLHASFLFLLVPDRSQSSWSQLSSSESNYKQRCLSKRFAMAALLKVKLKDICPWVLALGFLIGCTSKLKNSYLIFIFKKKAYVVLKLYMLPSGNKRFNFASFQACYILLQKHCKLPWDFIVRKHLEMGRIFSIIYLLLMHKCCLSYSCCHKKSMCFNSFYTALNNGPADMNSSNVYRKTL